MAQRKPESAFFTRPKLGYGVRNGQGYGSAIAQAGVLTKGQMRGARMDIKMVRGDASAQIGKRRERSHQRGCTLGSGVPAKPDAMWDPGWMELSENLCRPDIGQEHPDGCIQPNPVPRLNSAHVQVPVPSSCLPVVPKPLLLLGRTK